MNGITYNPPHKLAECSPSQPEEIAYSTEVLRCAQITIPLPKPDIETIIQVRQQIYLDQISIIPLKLGHSSSNGCKFLLRGYIRLEVEYSALCPEQTVHLVHTTLPFETLILGKSGKPIPISDCELENYSIHGLIEYLSADITDSRTFASDLVLLLWLQRKDSHCHSTDSSDYPFDHCSQADCHDLTCSSPTLMKQISVNEKEILPHDMPSIIEVLDNSVRITLNKAELIKTPLVIGPCRLPLKKVILKGHADVIVKYLTDKASQDVHAFSYRINLCSLIEWPGGPSINAPLCVEVSPEYLSTEMLSPRSIFTFLILRLDISA